MTALRPEYVDGLAVYRRQRGGEAPPVVLVHGSMDRAAAFRKAVRHAPELDITLYDRRGYGRSTDSGQVDSIDALVGDLLRVIGGRQTVVVGHSLGGVIALAAAERAPRQITAVGAFEAPMSWQPWWPSGSAGGVARHAAAAEGPEMAAEQFMRRMVGDERWEALPEGTRAQRRLEGRALLADLAALRSRPAPYDPAELEVPVVSGHGTSGSERHRRAARELAVDVPDGELVTIDGAPHNAHYTHPRAFAEFIRQVVDRSIC